MSARLTPEQAEAVDSTTKEFEDASVEAASNHNADGLGLINCRVLDLLDENAALHARAEQAEARLDDLTYVIVPPDCPDNRTLTSDEASRIVALADAMKAPSNCESGELIRLTAEMLADWPQYRSIHRPAAVLGIFAAFISGMSDAYADMKDRAEQTERDRAVLAAEVQAWRRFDDKCSARDQIVYTAKGRPTHPGDIMKATDASGALDRAKSPPPEKGGA